MSTVDTVYCTAQVSNVIKYMYQVSVSASKLYLNG